MPRWMVYTGSGSFTVPSDYAGPHAIVVAIGGGGGGARPANGNNPGGGGGGGGGLAYAQISVTAGQTIYYSAGTGGTSQTTSGSDGNSGNTSWINKSSNTAPSIASDGVSASGGAGGSINGLSAAGGTGLVGTGYTGGSGGASVGFKGGGGGGGSAPKFSHAGVYANGNAGGTASGTSGAGGGGVQSGPIGTTGGSGYSDIGGSGGAGGNGGNTSGASGTSGTSSKPFFLINAFITSDWIGPGGGGGGGAANSSGTGGDGGFGEFYGGGGGGGGWGTTTGSGRSGTTGAVIFIYVPTSMYWVGGSGTWSQDNATNWAASSGGAVKYGIPLASDATQFTNTLSSVNFLSTSFPGTSSITVTVGQGAGCNSLTFGALPYNLTFNSSGYTLSIYGNVTLQSTNLTWGFSSAVSLNETAGATKTIDTAGLTVNGAWSLTGVSASGWQLASNFTNTSTLELVSGRFNALTYNVDILSFASSNTNTRILYPGSGTWTLRGTGTIWNCATVTNLSVSPNSATINVTSTTPADRTFNGGNTGTMSYTDWSGLSITHSGTNSLIIVGQNKFNTITVGASRSIKFESGQTNRATTFAFAGTSPAARVTIESTSSGVPASLYKELPTATTANTVNVQNCSIKDIVAANYSVSYLAYTANGNLDNGGNIGWIFNPPNFLPLLD